ncbi:MAG TPA: nucleoside triphosphate pyrophosphatase [Longimicrobiales bacterium]|nr:nucleoside triphosphate pyrophosphatase [Longimicrobiales bacterium]
MIPPLVLASGSPRRQELLSLLGVAFEAVPAEVGEEALPGESAVGHVERLALEKARWVAGRRPGAVVVGGDTVVVLDDEILTKPASGADAVEMLLRLQGRTHRVETGIAVVAPGGRAVSGVVGADVRFRPFDRATAEAYVATGEPLDKAGSYGIQGRGSVLVDGINGDYYAIVGLPVARLMDLLAAVGFRYGFQGIQTTA